MGNKSRLTRVRGSEVASVHRPGRTQSARRHTSDIRAWAKDQGIAVSERGRIPASVVEHYQAATGRS
jgi:nucleoid-associated protein Lsr2